jgi:hypothetical protein
LGPFQMSDVGTPEARLQGELDHRCQVLRKLGYQSVRF